MALKPLQSQLPAGQYDGLDTQVLNLKGGEVVGLTYVTNTNAVDQAAADAIFDGYVSYSLQKRPAVTSTITSTMRPLFLSDEGVANYGTLYGQVVGGFSGLQVTSGSQLGPSTALGSGKVTIWGAPGFYAVTLDSVDVTVSTGLVPTNTSLVGRDKLYPTTAGLLTPTSGSAVASTSVVAQFIEFTTNGSLVNTPNHLVAALNSPSGVPAATTGNNFVQAVIYWDPNLLTSAT